LFSRIFDFISFVFVISPSLHDFVLISRLYVACLLFLVLVRYLFDLVLRINFDLDSINDFDIKVAYLDR